MRKLSHEEIVKRQENRASQPSLPLTVVLNNIRSLYNVGSIFRTADGAGVEKIWLCGITGFPPQAEITKTALGAETRVPWDHARDVLPVLRTVKKKGYQIVLLEQMDESLPFEDFAPQGPVCLVVGNEIQGIEERTVSLCDKTIEIEMAGLKNSLNVAVAFGIAVYHIRKHLKNFRS